MIETFTIRTDKEDFYNITNQVQQTVVKNGLQNGIVVVYCPHTTAGITINENADPDVITDLLFELRKAFPDSPQFLHLEGNSTAHLKASFVGASQSIPVQNGKLLLGRWQGIYFCEFDGPRNRQFFVYTPESSQ